MSAVNLNKIEKIAKPSTANKSVYYSSVVLSRVLGRLLNKEAKRAGLLEDGLRVYQIYLLNDIHLFSGGFLTEMASYIMMDRSTLVRNSAPLVRRGWVTVEYGNKDYRCKEVNITPSGRRYLEETLPLLQALEEEVIQKTIGLDSAAIVDNFESMISATEEEFRKVAV